MANVLVTGGCGFIGSYLVDALINAGHQVTVLDDLSVGNKERLNPQAQFIKGSVLDADIFPSLLKDIDCCFHLAAIASVERSRSEWFYAHQVNVGGIINLFSNIVKNGRQIPVVYASSSAVYGDSEESILSEETATAPFSAYGVDKLACEQHGRVASQIHHIPNIGLRFFNVYGAAYGPISPYSSVISIFRERIKQGLPITIFGNGEQSRDFIYIADAVSALMLAMQQLQVQDIRHGVFNACTGVAVNILTLAKIIGEWAGKAPEITFQPSRSDDILRSCGSPALALKMLNFKTKTTLQDGLRI